MKKTFILSALMTIASLATVVDKGSISGIVYDDSGLPLIGATVVLYKDKVLVEGTITDIDGKYIFSNLEAGTYEVDVTYVGYDASKVAGVIIGKEGNKEVNIEMEAAAVLDEVVVAGYGVRSKIKNLFKRKKQIESLPTKSISALAGTLAGVSVDKTGNVSVRGSRQETTFYYVDGVRVDSPSAMYEDKYDQEELSSTEGYDKPEENAFVSPLTESHSTFSLDVDKASYSNIRRMITYGQQPPPASVRVEEMVNYFEYDYKKPTGEHPIVVHQNLTTCPWNKEHQLLHLSAKAKEIDTELLPPSNLVYLVDVSGSMSQRNKLPLVIKSLKLLVEQLRPQDRVAIVTYAGQAGVALPSTSAADKSTIIAGLERLKSGGSTAGAEGIKTAYKIAKDNFIKGGNNRVILATDGDFNVGVNSAAGLEKLIEKKRKTGIFLSILGFGTGNYQDHKMQTLATKGNGNHAYIDSYSEAKKVFVKEFSGTLFTVAKDVKIQIEFNPAHVQSYRLIGYENRMLAKEDFNDDTKDAGEVGAGHTVTAIYEIIPPGSESEFSASVTDEEIKNSRAGKQADVNQALGYIKCRYKQPDGDKSIKFEDRISAIVEPIEKLDEDLQFSVAVAEFGLNLGQSKYLKTSDLNSCLVRATNSIGPDKEGYRNEFVELVQEYLSMTAVANKN